MHAIMFRLAGVEVVGELFTMRLSASGKAFRQAYLNEAQEVFLDGHVPRLQPAVQRMGQRIADPRLVAAIIDRLTFHAHIIETGNDSYRLRSTRTARRRKP